MRKRSWLMLGWLLLSGWLLTGCGQTGPLTLPVPKAPDTSKEGAQ